MTLKSFISSDQLKQGVLDNFKHGDMVYIRYDLMFDAFLIILTEPNIETVVHYINDELGLLYKPNDFEIVGFQIENFTRKFLPAHQAINSLWIKDKPKSNDFGGYSDSIWHQKPMIVREVARATEHLFEQEGFVIPKDLQGEIPSYSIAAV